MSHGAPAHFSSDARTDTFCTRRAVPGLARGSDGPVADEPHPLLQAHTSRMTTTPATHRVTPTLSTGSRRLYTPVPVWDAAAFHFVLARFMLLYGHFHFRQGPMRDVLPSWHYPAVIAGAFGLFAALQAGGAPLVASTYIPILATA